MPPGWLLKLWEIIKKYAPAGKHAPPSVTNNYDFRNAKNVVLVVNPNNNSPITINSTGDKVELNIPHLPAQAQAEIESIIARTIDESDGFILEETALSRIEQIQEYERQPEVKEEIDYFRRIIPAKDITTLRACFYLRRLYTQGDKSTEVSRLKDQIRRCHGKRGSNMANLCSAGYFDTWIKPLYEEMCRLEPDAATRIERFQKIYNTILEEQPWTIFVCHSMTEEQLVDQILYKLEKIRSYGTDFLNIHALSSPNVLKVRNVLSVVEQKRPELIKKVSEEGSSIFIRLRIPPAESPPKTLPGS